MKVYLTAPILLGLLNGFDAAFVNHHFGVQLGCQTREFSKTSLMGYLDDLSNRTPRNDEYDEEKESLEATAMDRNMVDRFGPASLQDFVDFSDEFDGGDGQMGVAGDGNKGLEKLDAAPTIFNKSKMMSAKNAWGTATGYAEELLKKNPTMDVSRAQQIENWQNQREVWKKQQYVKEFEIADQSRQESADMDWRQLAKFGVERNDKFDLDQTFGAVVAGDISDTLEFRSIIGRAATHTISVSSWLSYHLKIHLWEHVAFVSVNCQTHNLTVLDFIV